MKLKIYSDRSYLPDGLPHVTMLYPFWGKNPEDARDPTSGRYDRYVADGHRFFEMTSLAEADLAVLPSDWNFIRDQESAALFIEQARRAGKPTVVFFWSDSTEEVPVDDALIFRTSTYRSRHKHNEFAMPAWSEDFVASYFGGDLPIRQKQPVPVVSFCGYGGARQHSFKKLARDAASLLTKQASSRDDAKVVGRKIRAEALRRLSGSSTIQTDFIVREKFLGGSLLPDGRLDYERLNATRHEYVQNMIASDYVLVARGAGNFSYRLYETLSCGRIPIFIDTDSLNPYDFAVDWKEYCVWIDQTEISHIADKVMAFHNRLSPQEFVSLQEKCRALWTEWLSPSGFFANLHKHLREASL